MQLSYLDCIGHHQMDQTERSRSKPSPTPPSDDRHSSGKAPDEQQHIGGRTRHATVTASRQLLFLSIITAPFEFIGHVATMGWNALVSTGNTVAQAVSTAASALTFIVNGAADVSKSEQTGWEWNLPQGGVNEQGGAFSLQSCSAKMTYSISFKLTIRNHEVVYGHTIIEGVSELAAASKVNLNVAAETESSKTFGGVNVDPIEIMAGPVPITIQLSVPITIAWKLKATGKVQSDARASLMGPFTFGITFGTGGIRTINEHRLQSPQDQSPTSNFAGGLSLIVTVEPAVSIEVSAVSKELFKISASITPKIVIEIGLQYSFPAVRGCSLLAAVFADFSVSIAAKINIFTIQAWEYRTGGRVTSAKKNVVFGPRCIVGSRRRLGELPSMSNSLMPSSMVPGVMLKAMQQRGQNWASNACQRQAYPPQRQVFMQVPSPRSHSTCTTHQTLSETYPPTPQLPNPHNHAPAQCTLATRPTPNLPPLTFIATLRVCEQNCTSIHTPHSARPASSISSTDPLLAAHLLPFDGWPEWRSCPCNGEFRNRRELWQREDFKFV